MAQLRGIVLMLTMLLTASCSFNPFRSDNELTGSAASTATGAAIGGGAAALAHATKGEIGLAAIAGGVVGYYVSTLRFASGGVIQGGGKVYNVGDNIGIVLPTDVLFDVNSADLLPGSGPILDSVVDILCRYPSNNILVSGNTSGVYDARFERKLSEDRARVVASYLWSHGINNFEPEFGRMRTLRYVGYGNNFPISNRIRNFGIRQNSRIQITSYPGSLASRPSHYAMAYNNVGASTDQYSTTTVTNTPVGSFTTTTH